MAFMLILNPIFVSEGDMQEIYDGIIRKSWRLFALGIAGTFLAVSFYVTILMDYFTPGKILHNNSRFPSVSSI